MFTSFAGRATFGSLTAIALLAFDLTGGWADRMEGASVTIAARTVELAGRCDLHATIANVHMIAHNHGREPSTAKTIRVLDSSHALTGTSDVPELAPDESRGIDVPLTVDDGSNPVPAGGLAAIAGAHTFYVYLTDSDSRHMRLTTAAADLRTTISTAFCAQAIAQAAPTAAAASASAASATPTQQQKSNLATTRTFTGSRAQTLFGTLSPVAASMPTANPAVTSARITARTFPFSLRTPNPSINGLTDKRGVLAAIFPPPSAVHAVTGEDDCYGHFATQYAFRGSVECRAMISGGHLVLIWDAPPRASVDGYRVYPVGNNGGPGAVIATVHDRAQTLAQLPLFAYGDAGRCYVVTATYGTSESGPARQYCPGPTSTTVARTLGTSYTHYSFKDRNHQGIVSDFYPKDLAQDSPAVGYYYGSTKHTLGDTSYNNIRRYAVAFNLDSFKTKRLVSAHLRLTIQSSYGQGNNHSCATTVGSGTEFWWKDDAAAWTEGNFVSGARIGDTGPTVSADVTSFVAPILAGSPNYGFIVRNDDENLDAFTNAQCQTVYGNPQLDLVYYDK